MSPVYPTQPLLRRPTRWGVSSARSPRNVQAGRRPRNHRPWRLCFAHSDSFPESVQRRSEGSGIACARHVQEGRRKGPRAWDAFHFRRYPGGLGSMVLTERCHGNPTSFLNCNERENKSHDLSIMVPVSIAPRLWQFHFARKVSRFHWPTIADRRRYKENVRKLGSK